MAAPRPTGSIDIWNFVDNVTGTTVRKWLRDSWARKKIVALQQAVSSIVVPTRTSQLTNDSGYITQADVPPGSTPSSTTPLMDGTAAVGTENAFARGDHRHPTDTTRQAALSTAQLAAVNSGVTAAKVQAWDGITVPTKTSDLTNDSDFQTGTQVGNAISAEAGLMVPYGYCTTAAETVAKVVTVSPAVTELTTGLTIAVKFQYANTGSNPTLNVNSLGAKAIKRYGTTAAGTSAASNWNANSIVMLMYDGTYWMLVDFNNTTYSGMSDAEYQAGTGTSNRLITPARLKAAIELHAPVQSVNGQTGAVNLGAADVGALPDSTVIPSKTSQLTNDSGYITASALPSVPSASTTNPAMDGTASAGSSTSWSRGDHVHPHDTSKADKATTLSGYGITNAYTKTEVDGMIPTVPTNVSAFTNDAGYITASAVPDASSATPAMDGTGAAGSSNDYARADHVHPHDSSKQDALSTAQMAAVNSGITAQTLNPTAYTQFTPASSRCTYDAGGYVKVGKLVIIDVTLTMAANIGTSGFTQIGVADDALKILKGSGYTALEAVNQTSATKATKAKMASDGRLLLHNVASGDVVYVSGCYIAE